MTEQRLYFSEQTEDKEKEDRTKSKDPTDPTDITDPFLDFGDDDELKLDEDSEFMGKIPKIEKKAPPKNGK